MHHWHLPLQSGIDAGDIHYYAITASINDCLLRRRWDSSWVAVVDLDEFIVARQGRLCDMLPPDASALLFRNAFFPRHWPLDGSNELESTAANNVSEKTRRLLWRSSVIWEPYKRSKYVVRPERVRVAGNHFVFRFVGNASAEEEHRVVDESRALLHHYRFMEDGETGYAVAWRGAEAEGAVLDRAALRFYERYDEE